MTDEEQGMLARYLVETGELEADAPIDDVVAWCKEIREGGPVDGERLYKMTLTAARAYDRLKSEILAQGS